MGCSSSVDVRAAAVLWHTGLVWASECASVLHVTRGGVGSWRCRLESHTEHTAGESQCGHCRCLPHSPPTHTHSLHLDAGIVSSFTACGLLLSRTGFRLLTAVCKRFLIDCLSCLSYCVFLFPENGGRSSPTMADRIEPVRRGCVFQCVCSIRLSAAVSTVIR